MVTCILLSRFFLRTLRFYKFTQQRLINRSHFGRYLDSINPIGGNQYPGDFLLLALLPGHNAPAI